MECNGITPALGVGQLANSGSSWWARGLGRGRQGVYPHTSAGSAEGLVLTTGHGPHTPSCSQEHRGLDVPRSLLRKLAQRQSLHARLSNGSPFLVSHEVFQSGWHRQRG